MPCPEIKGPSFSDDPSEFFAARQGQCLLPLALSEQMYPFVEHTMLDEEGHQSPQRLPLVDCSGNEREQRASLFLSLHGRFTEFYADTSFTQQMHHVAPSGPDVFLGTYRSAVPVLAAVSGYYEELGLSVPIFDYVDVRHYGAGRAYLYEEDVVRKQATEAERLSRVVEGAKVVIIDEYCHRGSTLWKAGQIALEAGAASAVGIVGHWYRKLPTELPAEDYNELRILHSDFMTQVGRRAAQIKKQPKPPAIGEAGIRSAVDLKSDWML